MTTEVELPKSLLEGLFETWLSREETQSAFSDWMLLAQAGQLEPPDEARRLRELQEQHSPTRRLNLNGDNHNSSRGDIVLPRAPVSPSSSATSSPSRTTGSRMEQDDRKKKKKKKKKASSRSIARLAPLRSVGDDLEASSATTELALTQLWARFSGVHTEDATLSVAAFSHVAEVCGLPRLLGTLLFDRLFDRTMTSAGGPNKKGVALRTFLEYFRSKLRRKTPKSRLFEIVAKPGATSIDREDWVPILETIVRDHPGLSFLEDHAEFQHKYATTCIVRIYYRVNLSRTGRISRRELCLAEPCVLAALERLGVDDDINRELRYFSYEHFYVLYCRFWELDADRDSLLTREDLLKYGGHRLSKAIVDRIFDAAPRPYGDGDSGERRRRGHENISARSRTSEATVVEGKDEEPPSAFKGEQFGDYSDEEDDEDDETSEATDERGTGTKAQQQLARHKRQRRMLLYEAADGLSYADFIYFMLSEEDKGNSAALRYWFTCCDLDADGRIDAGDARHFYGVQTQRMECLGHEMVPFEDMVCQMTDMLHPKSLVTVPDGRPRNMVLTLQDLTSKIRVAGVFFDALFSLDKFVEFEQRDPFVERQKRDDAYETDWDRFAASEYARLATEDEENEQDDYDDDQLIAVDDFADDHDDDDDFLDEQQQGDPSGGSSTARAAEAPF